MLKKLESLDLVATFGLTRPRFPIPPHPLLDFFQSRDISYQKLGKLMKCSHMACFNYLHGRCPLPPERELFLQALAQRIREWEHEHGRLFLANPKQKFKTIRKAIKVQK